MKKVLSALVLALCGTMAMAQSKFNVMGTVMDKETSEAVEAATVRVLSLPDSTMVGGAATDMYGRFTVKDVKKGKYVLKVTFVGYNSYLAPLDLTNRRDKDVKLGNIALATDSKLLKEAKVTANVAKVQVSGDSIIYNPAAYHVAEGAVLEDLVKLLPGAKVDDGNIKINGKSVNKILMNGKEFFLNDTETAMKNLPSEMIDKIKTYDRKSDLSRITGIDDGEEETVIDLTVKKGMAEGWMGNVNLGAGTEHRYNNRLFATRQTETAQIQLVGGANNTGGRGFGGGGGRGGFGFGGGGGLRSNKDLGLNFGTSGDILETSGSLRYRYNGSDSRSWTSSEDFFAGQPGVASAAPFSNRNNSSKSSGDNWNTQFRFEWKPDSMTNILFRPSASYSRNRGYSGNVSATFKDDPYSRVDDPLASLDDAKLVDLLVSSNSQTQQTYSNNKNASGELQLNRRLNSYGRNVTLRLTGSIGDSESEQISAADVKSFAGVSIKNNNNRYYTTPGRNRSYSVQTTYSEPIGYKTYLQFSYTYNYSYTKNDRQAYIYELMKGSELTQMLESYRYDVAGILDRLATLAEEHPEIYARSQKQADLSQFSEYNNYNHTASVMFRRVRDNYNFSAGIDLLPQHSVLNYEKSGKKFDDVTQSVFNYAPRIDFRYRFDNMTNLQLGYNGRSQQPSMTNLLDITDDSDPFNITKGNTQLKPSFSHTMRAFFNTFQLEHQKNLFANISGSLQQNTISQMTTYGDGGVRTTKPMNINGNWNINGGLGGGLSLGSADLFNINTFANVSYNNSVGYSSTKDDPYKKRTTKTLNLMDDLSVGYRDEYFDFSINGSINYSHSTNNDEMAAGKTPDTYTFSYGAELDVRTELGLRFHSDISMQSRRGYAQSEMNTNELLWNAQVSQSLLRGALTLSLEVNDILGQQSNISRTITALSRTDSRSNAIYQYGMLRAIYRLNIFGSKSARQGMRGMGGMGGFGGGMPMGGGAMPMGGGGFGGGFGGGRMF